MATQPGSQLPLTAETPPARLSLTADELAKDYIDDYARTLILIAKHIAYRENQRVVSPDHKIRATEEIAKRRRKTIWNEVGLFFGSGFFGAAVQGFITEVSAGRMAWVVVYVVIGIIGLVVALVSLLR